MDAEVFVLMSDEEIRQELFRKYGKLDPDAVEKLVISRHRAEKREEREIYCPRCHRLMTKIDVNVREGTSVTKCPRCRFMEPMDLAYFRTVRADKDEVIRRLKMLEEASHTGEEPWDEDDTAF